MRKYLPFLAIALVIAIGVLFANLSVQTEIAVKAVAALLSVLLTLGLFMENAHKGAPTHSAKEEPRKPGQSSPKGASGELKGSADAEVITFLSRMQEKGRLIDFLMDDISAHADGAIVAAARVVHQGCRAVIIEHLTLVPVDNGAESSTITVPSGYNAKLYRLTGNLSGKAPFQGTLVHKGWKVTATKLPKVIASETGELPILAPAQVEV